MDLSNTLKDMKYYLFIKNIATDITEKHLETLENQSRKYWVQGNLGVQLSNHHGVLLLLREDADRSHWACSSTPVIL